MKLNLLHPLKGEGGTIRLPSEEVVDVGRGRGTWGEAKKEAEAGKLPISRLSQAAP